MKKPLNKIKNSILFYTIVFLVLFIIFNTTLKLFNIQFRQWVYWCVPLVTVIGIILGAIQILRKTNKNVKKVFLFIIIGIIILLTLFWRYILLILAFAYSPEHIVIKDEKKYVAYVNSFLQVTVNYYDYINFFLVGNKVRIYEDYGNGGYDPFDEKHSDSKPVDYYYYDENGNIIKTNNEYISKIPQNQINKNIEEKTTIKNNKDDEVLYEKKIDSNISIRVIYKGSVLAQRSIIGIEKTIDGGITWKEQLETVDGFIQIHNGAKFVFIDENVGFINDFGLAGTNGENRELLVTTDGGKNFDVVQIKLENSEENLYIEDVPYKENGILKLKAYSIESSGEKYYYFYSENNGKDWKQVL